MTRRTSPAIARRLALAANDHVCLEAIIETNESAWASLVDAERATIGFAARPPSEFAALEESVSRSLNPEASRAFARLFDARLELVLVERAAAFRLGLAVGRRTARG